MMREIKKLAHFCGDSLEGVAMGHFRGSKRRKTFYAFLHIFLAFLTPLIYTQYMCNPIPLFNLKSVDFATFSHFEMKEDVSIFMTGEEEEIQRA